MIITEKASEFLDKKYTKYLAEATLLRQGFEIVGKKIKVDPVTCDFVIKADDEYALVFIIVDHEEEDNDLSAVIKRSTMRALLKKVFAKYELEPEREITPMCMHFTVLEEGKAIIEMFPMRVVTTR